MHQSTIDNNQVTTQISKLQQQFDQDEEIQLIFRTKFKNKYQIISEKS